MIHNTTTTIDIAGTLTCVTIDFKVLYGEISIIKMSDTETGDTIAPDLLGESDMEWLKDFVIEYQWDTEHGRR
jgi:hypothetical protein